MTLKISLYIEVADSQTLYVQDTFSYIISKLLELRENLEYQTYSIFRDLSLCLQHFLGKFDSFRVNSKISIFTLVFNDKKSILIIIFAATVKDNCNLKHALEPQTYTL